jgi:hypothetical protein
MYSNNPVVSPVMTAVAAALTKAVDTTISSGAGLRTCVGGSTATRGRVTRAVVGIVRRPPHFERLVVGVDTGVASGSIPSSSWLQVDNSYKAPTPQSTYHVCTRKPITYVTPIYVL